MFYLNPSFEGQQIYVRAEKLVALIPILHSYAVFTWKRDKFYTNLQMMIMNKMNRSYLMTLIHRLIKSNNKDFIM